jgi:anti-sigma factor RsiW
MDCPIETRENLDALMDYCAGRLEPQTRGAVERHLARCAACRDWTAAHRVAWKALDRWEVAPISPDFDRRLYQKIDAEQGSSWWAALVRPWAALRLRPALSVVMAALLLLAAVLIQSPGLPPAEQAQIESVDADRLESALEDLEMLRLWDQAAARGEVPVMP